MSVTARMWIPPQIFSRAWHRTLPGGASHVKAEGDRKSPERGVSRGLERTSGMPYFCRSKRCGAGPRRTCPVSGSTSPIWVFRSPSNSPLRVELRCSGRRSLAVEWALPQSQGRIRSSVRLASHARALYFSFFTIPSGDGCAMSLSCGSVHEPDISSCMNQATSST